MYQINIKRSCDLFKTKYLFKFEKEKTDKD